MYVVRSLIQVATAFQILSDPERKERYDRSGGRDEGHEDVDPFVVFSEVFKDYSVREVRKNLAVNINRNKSIRTSRFQSIRSTRCQSFGPIYDQVFSDALLARIKSTLWQSRRVSVTSHTLRLSNTSVRLWSDPSLYNNLL
jgi:DnaJ-class molecular chaperone